MSFVQGPQQKRKRPPCVSGPTPCRPEDPIAAAASRKYGLHCAHCCWPGCLTLGRRRTPACPRSRRPPSCRAPWLHPSRAPKSSRALPAVPAFSARLCWRRGFLDADANPPQETRGVSLRQRTRDLYGAKTILSTAPSTHGAPPRLRAHLRHPVPLAASAPSVPTLLDAVPAAFPRFSLVSVGSRAGRSKPEPLLSVSNQMKKTGCL